MFLTIPGSVAFFNTRGRGGLSKKGLKISIYSLLLYEHNIKNAFRRLYCLYHRKQRMLEEDQDDVDDAEIAEDR